VYGQAVGDDPEKDGPAKPADDADLDLEDQIERLAAALQFDLEDEETDHGKKQARRVPADLADVEELDPLEIMEAQEDSVVELVDIHPTLYLMIEDEVAEVDEARFVIGRATEMCDLAIIDVNVSRQHCAIERREAGYFIVDLGSTNGVEIEGKRVDDHLIAEGDELVISGHRIRASFSAPSGPLRLAEPLDDPDLPEVTGEFVAAGGSPAREEPLIPDATGEFEAAPPEPDPPPEPAAPIDPSPESATGHPPGHHTTPSFMYDPARSGEYQAAEEYTYEQRVEIRLEHLSQQVAYLQQTVQVLLAHVEQLQGFAGLANMIQQRLAAKQRRR
jgi:hypothetical protein